MTSRNLVCLSWGKVLQPTAYALSSAPWLSLCFTSTSLWFWVRPSLSAFSQQEFWLVKYENAMTFAPFFPASGTGEPNLAEAESLLKPYVEKFPNVSWFLRLYHKMESCISECICPLAVHREPSCSSTWQESHCSKATLHLWVPLMHLQPELMLFFLIKNDQLAVKLFPAGPREVLGVYCSTGGVAPDPSPVLLGADVGLFLWIKMEGSVSLRWPALQREQVVTGAAASTTA